MKIVKGYELRRMIGEGGFGAVYNAYQTIVEREVAIKIIHADYANHPDFIRRFETEARMIARLEHLHIVPLYDFWRERAGAYLVMRWLRGGSLRGLLRREQTLSVKQVNKILQQIGSALVLAHRQGVVHRDIKPENILLDEAKNAYLTDFGIAIDLTDDNETMSELMSFGSPAYISPEQVTGRMITPLADVYSMGILIYELLTGEIPFHSKTTTTTLLKSQINDPVPSILAKRPDLPPLLDTVIWQATAKTPSARYSSVIDLLKAFVEVTGSEIDSYSDQPEDYLDIDRPTSHSNTRPIASTQAFSDRVVDGGTRPMDVSLNPHTLSVEYQPMNPYKGLLPFDEADATLFHGREQMIHEMLINLRENNQRFLAVVGPSGSGKSSLVKAGILPGLRRGAVQNAEQWFYIRMTPGSDPFGKLTEALLQVLIDPVEDLEKNLRTETHALNKFVQTKRPLTDSDLLIFIDQFEEIFTLVEDEAERAAFLNLLASIEYGVRVIITLRADYYDRPLMYPRFGEIIRQNTVVVLPLSPDELRDAVSQPAQHVGVNIEPGLVNAIVKDVAAQPGALPLVQYALTELFDRRADNVMNLQTYQQIGGISGALARRASEIYADLNEEQQHQARRLFLRLVAVDDSGRASRRRALWHEVRPMRELVDLFTQYRLLTTDRDSVTRTPTVEVAHEAILTEWNQLKAWIDDNRVMIKRRQALSIAAHEWETAKRDTSYLARGARLVEFESLLEEPLTEVEQTFIEQSIVLRKRALWRVQLVIGVLVLFTLVSSVLAFFALDRQSKANEAAAVSRSRELAATTLSRLDQPDLALLLAVESVNAADTYEARNSLIQALQANPFIVQYLYSGAARAVAYDGQTIVTGGDSLIRWQNGQPTYLEGHTRRVNSVALHDDLIASAGDDGTIRLWGRYEAVFDVGEAVRQVVFSPDAHSLVTVDETGRLMIWDVSTGEIQAEIPAHGDIAYAAAYSPDGQIIATAGADNLVKLWDATTGEALTDPLSAHTNWVLTIAFSPSGRLLASAGADGQLIFWDMESYQPIAQVESGHTGWIQSLAFSADGQILLSASADNTIRAWDLATMQPTVLESNSGTIWSVAFDPESLQFASAGDETLVWDIALPQRPGEAIVFNDYAVERLLIHDAQLYIGDANGNIRRGEETLVGHRAPITSLDVDEQGRLLSAAADGTVIADGQQLIALEEPVWAARWDGDTVLVAGDHPVVLRLDATTGETITEYPGVTGVLSLVTDGEYMAVGERDGMIRVWKGDTLLYAITAHENSVTALLIQDDMLISAGRDRVIKLWDIRTGELLQPPLTGHTDWVLDLAFDDGILASGGRDGIVRLWALPEGRPLGGALIGHFDWVNAVALGDGVLYSGGRDQTVIAWDVALDNWLERACDISNRTFTAEEVQQFFPNGDPSTCADPTP